MKILHVINNLDYGGAQSVLRQLIEGWQSKDDEHQIISLQPEGPLSRCLTDRGIRVVHLDLLPGRFKLTAFRNLVREMRISHPDIVQTWLYHSDLLGGLAARFIPGTPVIWGVHHTTHSAASVTKSTWRIIKLLVFLSRKIPTKIICCSDSAYQSHLKLGYPESKMVTIYNGVDTQLFVPQVDAGKELRAELEIPSNTRLIGMFARYNPQKDHCTFLRAAAILSKRMPEAHFVLAGARVDPSNEDLNNTIMENDLVEQVHLIGQRRDMPFLNAGVDVVTLSSAYGEALPVTLCEAMSCGTLCVATDIGDSRKVIGDCGTIVQPRNPALLAMAWEDMLILSEEETVLLARKARARIIESYDLNKMVNQYWQIYSETIHGV